jgi:hypothetical protein
MDSSMFENSRSTNFSNDSFNDNVGKQSVETETSTPALLVLALRHDGVNPVYSSQQNPDWLVAYRDTPGPGNTRDHAIIERTPARQLTIRQTDDSRRPTPTSYIDRLMTYNFTLTR